MAVEFDKALCVVGGIISLNIFTLIGTYFTSFEDKTKYRLLLSQFFIVAQSLLFFLARYVWLRVGPPLFKSSNFLLVRILMYLVGIILILAQCCLFTGTIFAGVEPRWITLLTYTCLGVTVLMAGISIIFDLLWWSLSHLLRISLGASLIRVNRTRLKLILILVISTIVSIYGLHQGYRQPGIRSLEIPLKNLPSEFSGTSVIHLSDIHVGQTVGRTMLEDVVRVTNSLQPDIVVITGDLVDGSVYQLRQAVKPLIKLRAKYGVYFVTGNHEYYTGDIDAWMKELWFLGITVLHNAHTTIHHAKNHKAMLSIAGVDDVEGHMLRAGDHGMQIQKALKGLKPNTATIVLAHQPKAAKVVLDNTHQVGLVLSGHTHAGQLFPLHLWHWLAQPYFSGLYKHARGSYVYVSSGVFYWAMPMRVLSSAEIVHITLTQTPIKE